MSEESLLKNYGEDIDLDKFKEFIWKLSMKNLKGEFEACLRQRDKRYFSHVDMWEPANTWGWSDDIMSQLPKEITFQHLEYFLKEYERIT